jgi:hypothetical protein
MNAGMTHASSIEDSIKADAAQSIDYSYSYTCISSKLKPS